MTLFTRAFFILLLVSSFQISANQNNDQETIESSPDKASEKKQNEDITALKEGFEYLFMGGLEQFKTKNNLYYLGAALPTTIYAFEEDKRLSDSQRSKKLRKVYDITGDMGVVFNTPLVALGSYYLGKSKGDSHLMQFSKEYFAAMYLTLLETGIISYIPGHERPNKEGQSVWETAFRGENSFPSGHIVPYTVLFFKTLQFYGPYWAAIPAVLSYFSSMQRVREGRHYVSDVIGSFWLSAFASEGVRQYAKYKKNHPFYKMIFERDLRISYIRYRSAIGPKISFNW